METVEKPDWKYINGVIKMFDAMSKDERTSFIILASRSLGKSETRFKQISTYLKYKDSRRWKRARLVQSSLRKRGRQCRTKNLLGLRRSG